MTRRVNPPKRVVIVGGGTAGWMTAAAFAKALGGLPVAISLIESEEIGTVGVGEATIPAIHHFNAYLGLNQADFMRACQATFKLGIEFVNWDRPGKSYIHPFTRHGLDLVNLPFHQLWLRHARSALDQGDTGGIEGFSLACQAARRGLFAHPVSGAGSDLTRLNYAFHFDASLYARYLRTYAEARGVTRIEGRISHTGTKAGNGFVETLTLADGREIQGDFFVDCSGFRGLLIEQALGTGYDDWTHWLPCNQAIAMPSTHEGELLPITTATADEAGWQWSIPLQHRRGNGYVFANAFIDEDTARASLLKTLRGQALAEPRSIHFQAGKRRHGWNRNVVAIGLSSGFIEPLESTSIHLIQTAILRVLAHFPDETFAPADIAAYNRETTAEIERVRDFVILHYKVAGRDDTPFWRHCRDIPVPDSLSDIIETFRSRGRLHVSQDNLFGMHSWLSVLLGQGVIPESHDPLAEAVPEAEITEAFASQKAQIAEALRGMHPHRAYLERFCGVPQSR